MKPWGRMLLVLGVLWLLIRWVGAGPLVVPDLKTAALWAAILLALFLAWRDGYAILVRCGLVGRETPLGILERRLASGELDLDSYRRLRNELLDVAGIARANKNTGSTRVLRGDRRG